MKLYVVIHTYFNQYVSNSSKWGNKIKKVFADKEEAEDYKKYLEAVYWEGGDTIKVQELEIDTMFKEIESLEISIKYFSDKRYADNHYFENKIEFMKSLIKKYEKIDFSI
jgi:hypothetical protein